MNPTSPETPLSNLRQLANTILANIDRFKNFAEKQGVSYPTIDTLYDRESQPERFTIQPDVLNASSQLVATLKLPGLVVLDRANAFHISCAMRIMVEAGVVEILREAGPDGLHVTDIASKVGVEPIILGTRRVPLQEAQGLATHYVFRELNVFVNNWVSSLMDSGKADADIFGSLKDVKQRKGGAKSHGVTNIQGDKYTGTNGISALVEQRTDEVFKPSACPLDIALQFDGSMWEFSEKNPGYLQRVQMAMGAWTNLHPHQADLKGKDFSPGSVVVDVGGGNGSEGFEIAKRAPKVKVIDQDREQTSQNVTMPTRTRTERGWLESGRNQPSHLEKRVRVFFLRLITHDWPTKEGVQILRTLREAASPTRLVIVDQIVPYACSSPGALGEIEGATLIEAPSPILANLGEATSGAYN
ncbi:S-adenosyl-L-methionine-dependent methyltransferase [Pleurotus eryngii]|uniref:S-adenosyl-L-methionine-dependent methyltransferase n=1 Tax=Pleurotus eryngii TaxID=5323 RepID=A0A9P5ZGV7_PLEER|nr:S-adenosyl-L-methionine-dependent methyltransferase [Pleurotus eryngii]